MKKISAALIAVFLITAICPGCSKTDHSVTGSKTETAPSAIAESGGELPLTADPLESKLTCLLTQAPPQMKADCSAPPALPQSPPVFAIRPAGLLAHIGLPVQCPCTHPCKHGSYMAAVRGFQSKKSLSGLFGGYSRVDKTMWVSLTEDIEGVEEGHGVTINLTDELEKQISNYEIGDKLYVYYDDISITDEPLIETPYCVVLAE